MSDTSGPPSQTPFAFYDPEESCWRTSQATFLSDSDRYSATWPKSGMTHAGSAYELPMPALRTVALESSSLLPTPRSVLGTKNTTQEHAARQVERHGYKARLREEAITLLPTPTAQASKHDADDRGGPGTLDDYNLWSVAPRLMPTPRALGQRTSRHAATTAYRRSAPSLEQAMEIAQGIMPRELQSWDEAQESWRPTGEPSGQPSDDGKAFWDVPLPLPPSLTDEAETA